MDLNEIVVFAKVVETRSFTAAAAQLGLPKSTVSRKIAQLEERLGVRLLQRTTRKLSLTEVGQAYYERCTRIVSDISAAEQLVTEMQTSPRGLLRITAPVDLGSSYLGELCADFLRQQSDIAIELDLSDRVIDLVEEGIDVAIRFGPLTESTLVARRLGAIQAWLCASPAYLAANPTIVRYEDLDDHQCLLFAPTPRNQQWVLKGPDGRVEFAPSARLSSNSLKAVRDACVAGGGVALLPTFVLVDDLRAGRLHRILPAYGLAQGDVFAVYPSTRNLSPKVRAFLEFVVARMTPPPWQLEIEAVCKEKKAEMAARAAAEGLEVAAPNQPGNGHAAVGGPARVAAVAPAVPVAATAASPRARRS